MLKIYNTASRSKEEFKPTNPELVTMYNCGLTVYDYPHIGNLRAYTMVDSIRRTLEYLGYTVKQVMNWTDVGHLTFTDEQKELLKDKTDIMDADAGLDRMEKAAKKTGKTVWEVADYYIAAAEKDFTLMNFVEPEVRPRATQHIQEQIDMIQILVDKGYAYITPSAIYFDTSKSKNYGFLTGQKLEDKKTAVRDSVELDPNKRNPSDFRLWQLDQPDHAMQWPSPWGNGFPGWHIECSAMSHKYLGEPIDIHTGGVDHISVHHTNEIAQSEATFDKQFVNYWYHNEMILVEGRKMSKSLGNAYTIEALAQKGYEPMDLRYFYLTANFRTRQNLTLDALSAARSARKRLVQNLQSIKSSNEKQLANQSSGDNAISSNEQNVDTQIDVKATGSQSQQDSIQTWKQQFVAAIEDSFDMPQALAHIWKLLDDKELSDESKLSLVLDFDKVLGLSLAQSLATQSVEQLDSDTETQLQDLIAQRKEAKQNKDYVKADSIREQVTQLGFELIDTKEGTTWRRM